MNLSATLTAASFYQLGIEMYGLPSISTIDLPEFDRTTQLPPVKWLVFWYWNAGTHADCLQKNRRQIIYLELCCCFFGPIWGRQRWGWTSVADVFMLLDLLAMAIMVTSDVGHRLFDSSVRYKKRTVQSGVEHLSKYKEYLHTHTHSKKYRYTLFLVSAISAARD